MTRLRGRAPRGERLVASAPHGHWNTTTFLAGLRQDRIVAPLVLDGPINGRAFRAYFEQFLASTALVVMPAYAPLAASPVANQIIPTGQTPTTLMEKARHVSREKPEPGDLPRFFWWDSDLQGPGSLVGKTLQNLRAVARARRS